MAVDLGSMKVLLQAQDNVSGKLNTVKGNVGGLSGAISKMGLASTLSFAALAYAAFKAFKTVISWAMEFETELANVATMLDKSTMHYMPQYENQLMQLARKYGESTKTLSKGLYDVLSASIGVAEAMEVVEVSAIAAKAGLTDTGVAADAITTVMNSYARSSFEAMQVSDMLFGIVKKGKTTFAELAPAIGASASLAAMAGIEFQELGAMISTLTRAGIDTNSAMTALNGVIRAFLKPTDDAKELAKEFGIEMNTAEIRGMGLLHTMRLLKGATEEQLATLFPNIRGLKGISAALENLDGAYEDYMFILNSAGLSNEALGLQTDTLSFQLKQLYQTIKTGTVEALGPDIESTKEMAKQMNSLLGNTNALMEKDIEYQTAIDGINQLQEEYGETLDSQIVRVDEYRDTMEDITEAINEQKSALKELDAELKGYLDVAKLEGYEETTKNILDYNDKITAQRKLLNKLKIEGKEHTSFYKLQREELDKLNTLKERENLKLEEGRNFIAQKTAAMKKDLKTEADAEMSQTALSDAIVTATANKLKYQKMIDETMALQKEERKSFEEDVIAPLDTIRDKIEELVKKVHIIKLKIQTEGEIPGADGKPSILSNLFDIFKGLTSQVPGAGMLSGVSGASNLYQTITINTDKVTESPDDIAASYGRMGIK